MKQVSIPTSKDLVTEAWHLHGVCLSACLQESVLTSGNCLDNSLQFSWQDFGSGWPLSFS